MIAWLGRQVAFPPVETALREPNGLLAAGGDLSPARLLAAYRLGIFPWYSAGEPILWWSPDPRMVLFPGELKVSRSLRKRVRREDHDVSFDAGFAEVVSACAAPRADGAGTWITPEMQQAYCRLHALGHAHSVEVRIGNDLVGGLYGVAIGRVFFGESMFARATDASKIALVHLVARLKGLGFALIDCQMTTAHLASLGAREIPRHEFSAALARLTRDGPHPGKWTAESAIAAAEVTG